jgi:hypothetical protein
MLMHEAHLTHHRSTIFWDVAPCSPVETRPRFGGMYCLHLQIEELAKQVPMYLLPLFFCFAYSSALMTESVRSCETSVNFYETSQRRVPDDGTVLFSVTALRQSPVSIRRVLLIILY